MRKILTSLMLALALPAHANLETTVIDVGAGLCTVTVIPDSSANGQTFDENHFVMVYDTGKYSQCSSTISRLYSEISEIDLLVISHSDFDHVGGFDEIESNFTIGEVWHTGFVRQKTFWTTFTDSLEIAEGKGTTIRSLGDDPIVPGTTHTAGDAQITEIFGLHAWSGGDPITKKNERRNALSIVLKLTYNGKSILFTGDTLGRRLNDEFYECKDAELQMVNNADSVPLTAEVMFAPHHGANNGSAMCFLAKVDPKWVIFAAGHSHQHPTTNAYLRYKALGLDDSRFFRTDLGDNEEGEYEWTEGNDCKDIKGDDDIVISISSAGAVSVNYRDDGGANECDDDP